MLRAASRVAWGVLAAIVLATCGVAAPGPRLEGYVLHNGQQFPVDFNHVVVQATRCKGSNLVRIDLVVRKTANSAHPEPVLSITADPTRVTPGVPILPQSTLDARTGANGNPPASLVAWTTWRLLGKAHPKKPGMGLILFTQLAPDGPVAVKFDADFDGGGHVKGYLQIDHTTPGDCK